MSSAAIRIGSKVLPGLLPVMAQGAEGAIGLSVLSNTVDTLESNPIIPIVIASILVFVVIQKK
jgi:hypothetical protein